MIRGGTGGRGRMGTGWGGVGLGRGGRRLKAPVSRLDLPILGDGLRSVVD